MVYKCLWFLAVVVRDVTSTLIVQHLVMSCSKQVARRALAVTRKRASGATWVDLLPLPQDKRRRKYIEDPSCSVTDHDLCDGCIMLVLCILLVSRGRVMRSTAATRMW